MVIGFEKSPYTKYVNNAIDIIHEIEDVDGSVQHDICELLKVQTVYLGSLLDTLNTLAELTFTITEVE